LNGVNCKNVVSLNFSWYIIKSHVLLDKAFFIHFYIVLF
jgi:hypothetical protein